MSDDCPPDEYLLCCISELIEPYKRATLYINVLSALLYLVLAGSLYLRYRNSILNWNRFLLLAWMFESVLWIIIWVPAVIEMSYFYVIQATVMVVNNLLFLLFLFNMFFAATLQTEMSTTMSNIDK